MTNLNSHSTEFTKIRREIENIFEQKLEESIKPKYRELILMSRKDTAKYLCISLPTLHDWTKNGILKANRIGNRVLYKLSDILDALNEISVTKKREGELC